MYERVLQRMREKIRILAYVLTDHAEQEMEDDDLTILDVEHVVFSGRIVARQRDRRTRQAKYVVAGQAEAGDQVEIVGRLSVAGKLVIVTMYRA